MSYCLTEPCCGSAALTLHMLGAKRPLMPYQGSKWSLREPLAQIMAEHGFTGAPANVRPNDAGPWGMVMPLLMYPWARQLVIQMLADMADMDPLERFNCYQGATVPVDQIRFAAEFLWLQRLAFSGKAVGIAHGRWVSPGFNRTSAYGVPATPRFGAVKPMIPSLVATLRSYDFSPRAEISALPRVVYLDPPYQGTTPYPNGHMSREDVVFQAQRFKATPGVELVMVSEATPVGALVEQGWRTRCIRGPRAWDGSPFKGKQEEWVTYL